MADTVKDSSQSEPHEKQIVTSEETSLPKPHGKEIIMQTETTNLLTLKPTDLDKCIHVKVYRKWTTINKASVPTMHCCILLDQQVVFYFIHYHILLYQQVNFYFLRKNYTQN